MGNPALTIVANCFEKIRISSTFGFFLPKSESPEPFFLSLVSFLDFFDALTKFVIIIFCSLSLWDASSAFNASMSPYTYFASEIPL